MPKGITPIISIILLLLIVISLIGAAYMFFGRTTQSLGNQTEKQVTQQMELMGIKFTIDNVGKNDIYIRNKGTTEIDSSNIGVYLDGNKLEPTNTVTIAPGEVKALTFQENIIGKILKVTGGMYQDIISLENVSYVLIYKIEEYEYFSNGNRCSNGLYVIENNRVKFFVSVPRTYTPVTSGNCASGVSSYDDTYAGVPMRIWANDTQSSSYKLNSVVIDDTRLYAPSATSVSDINKFKELNNGLEIEFNQQGNIIPKVIYTSFYDKNYIRVDLSATNVGSSATSVRLRWEGDQDGAGTCRFQSGFQTNCDGGPYRVDTGEKWLAQWRDFNDMMGYIVLDGELEIYSQWAGVRIEETSSTTLQPGDTHIFTFYIVADKKVVGNEWKPVEDLYNQLSG